MSERSERLRKQARDVTRIYTEVRSQPGRMLNDFRNLGFNQAENGKAVFNSPAHVAFVSVPLSFR